MHRDDETTRAMAYSCRPSHAASFLIALLALPLLAAASSAAPGPAPAIKIRSMDHRGLSVMPLPSPVSGPESLAFDRRGGGPYAGVSDGRVLRWRGRRLGWTVFAYNSRHKSVGMCAARKKLMVPESVCGRPLGLQFDHKTGDLYVADAYLGLLRVPARGGMAEVVATEAGGVPFNFLNGLDVDQKTGHVYFTDSSTFYRRSQYLLVVALGDETGRLLRYDPRTRRVAVLHDSLSYPNGVAVAADGSSVVVSHTALCELRRYWVRGARAGENETFAELPGYPDNVRPDGGGRGGYWVGMNRDKDWADSGTTADSMSAVRVVVPAGRRNGTVATALRGFGDATVSEVVQRNGSLWIGSVDTPYVGLFKFASLTHS